MSLRQFNIIQIQQVPTDLHPSRTNLLTLDFVHSYECESGWESHTDVIKVQFPKNVVLQTEDFLFQQSGTYNVILGGSGAIQNGRNVDTSGNPITLPPLIMRGDILTIQSGYYCKNNIRNVNPLGEDVILGTTIFTGFVSEVVSNIPIEIKCEDNFYLLKRTPFNKTYWKGNLVDMCKYIVDEVNDLFGKNEKFDSLPNGNPYPILSFFDRPDAITANFSLGHLDVGEDMTCSLVLDRVQNSYNLYSFFSDNVLRFGFPIYDESTANNSHVFEFQNNILNSDGLTYKNKDDVVLSAVVSCQTINKTGKKTRDGKEKTKRERDSLFIYWDIITETFKYVEKKKGESFPRNEGGERHEFIYPVDPSLGKPTTEQLFDYGKKQLEKYFYTGFRGSFVTIGFPFVKWGDNITLLNNIFADQNGRYKVKKVVYKGGEENLTQEIFLDYKLNVELTNSYSELYLI